MISKRIDISVKEDLKLKRLKREYKIPEKELIRRAIRELEIKNGTRI